MDDNKESCVICMEGGDLINKQSEFRKCACKHNYFHSACWNQYVSSGNAKVCATCRAINLPVMLNHLRNRENSESSFLSYFSGDTKRFKMLMLAMLLYYLTITVLIAKELNSFVSNTWPFASLVMTLIFHSSFTIPRLLFALKARNNILEYYIRRYTIITAILMSIFEISIAVSNSILLFYYDLQTHLAISLYLLLAPAYFTILCLIFCLILLVYILVYKLARIALRRLNGIIFLQKALLAMTVTLVLSWSFILFGLSRGSFLQQN